MLRRMRSFLGVIASEDGLQKQSILPVAWVGAVLMAAAVVLSMPEKAHAVCYAGWDCEDLASTSYCPTTCQATCGTSYDACVQYGSTGRYRCRCE